MYRTIPQRFAAFNQRPFRKALLGGLATALAVALAPAPASAQTFVDDPAFFELEGDAVTNITAGGPDWSPTPPPGTFAFTGIVADYQGTDRGLTGGKSKDVWDVALWEHNTPVPLTPDKDNITNAYAAAYSIDHDNLPGTPAQLWLTFGADRFANDGSASIGYWFRQSAVAVNTTTGGFDGASMVNDVLVVADFLQGGVLSDIKAYRVSAIAGNGKLDLEDLNLTAGLSAGPCDSAAPSHDVCAISNTGLTPITAPWTYFFKGVGSANMFPQNTFFEGAINMSKIFTTVPCFTSFMTETRTSGNSITSTLKDFTLGSLDVCPFNVQGSCGTSVIATVGGQETLQYPISVTLNNGGFGSVSVTAFAATANLSNGSTAAKTLHTGNSVPVNHAAPGTNLLPTPAFSIGPGANTYNGHLDHLTNPPSTVTSMKFDATISLGGGVTKSSTTTVTCTQGQFGMLTASKSCVVPLPTAVTGVGLVIGVNVSAQVCNTTPVSLSGVSAADDEGGALTFNGSTTTTLGPATPNPDYPATSNEPYIPTCKTFIGSYNPDTCEQPGAAGRCTFSDTLTSVTGTVVVNGGAVSVPVESLPSASCTLCPSGTCALP